MKFAVYCVPFLVLLILDILAGCTQTQAPVSTPVSLAMPTPVSYTNLSQLFLSQAEIPFRIRGINTLTPNMRDPSISQFGGLRGASQFVIDQSQDSATSTQVGQTIVAYPRGNAVLAYDAFVNQTRNADQSAYTITWLTDPGIGEKSSAFMVSDKSGKDKPMVMIVFVKSNLMESVVMLSPATDIPTATLLGRMAAAKIP